MKKGEITAFLSLIFVLMISFVTAILESASVQAEKNQARLDMDRAVYSVFGEYQKELLEEYGIFAVEGSYETGRSTTFTREPSSSLASTMGDASLT